MNKAIDTLPSLRDELFYLETSLMPRFVNWKTRVQMQQAENAEAVAAADTLLKLNAVSLQMKS